MKKVELLFYRTNPSEGNQGIKNVLVQITDPDGNNAYDWGMCYWDGKEWGSVGEVPEGFTVSIHSWSNMIDPAVILTEPSRIIPIKGKFDI